VTRVGMGALTLAAVAALAATLVAEGGAAGSVTSVAGAAYGVEFTGTSPFAAVPDVTLPSTGGASRASVPSVVAPVNGLATGTALVGTIGARGTHGFAESHALLLGVALSAVPGAPLTATVVRSGCRVTQREVLGATHVLGGRFGGVPLPVKPAPNTTLANPLGTLVLNEQTATASGMSVTAMHLTLTEPAGEQIFLGHTECNVTKATAAALKRAKARAAKLRAAKAHARHAKKKRRTR